MIKFISCLGYVLDDEGDVTSYIGFNIEGGNSSFCIGDQIWCNENELEIFDLVSSEHLKEFLAHVEPKSRLAIRGALRRLGVEVD